MALLGSEMWLHRYLILTVIYCSIALAPQDVLHRWDCALGRADYCTASQLAGGPGRFAHSLVAPSGVLLALCVCV